jgi:transposase IS4-like protein
MTNGYRRIVSTTGCAENRRRLPSARFTVYFVLALCLFPQADYLEVLRPLKASEPVLRPWTGVNKSPLTRARRRLGWPVMRELCSTAVSLLIRRHPRPRISCREIPSSRRDEPETRRESENGHDKRESLLRRMEAETPLVPVTKGNRGGATQHPRVYRAFGPELGLRVRAPMAWPSHTAYRQPSSAWMVWASSGAGRPCVAVPGSPHPPFAPMRT